MVQQLLLFGCDSSSLPPVTSTWFDQERECWEEGGGVRSDCTSCTSLSLFSSHFDPCSEMRTLYSCSVHFKKASDKSRNNRLMSWITFQATMQNISWYQMWIFWGCLRSLSLQTEYFCTLDCWSDKMSYLKMWPWVLGNWLAFIVTIFWYFKDIQGRFCYNNGGDTYENRELQGPPSKHLNSFILEIFCAPICAFSSVYGVNVKIL